MKFRAIVLILSCIFLISLSGCNQAETQGGDINTAIKNFISGDVTGELNKSYSTKWFDFTVKSIKTAYEFGDYAVDDGYKFIVVAVSETNTFDEPIPMSAYDFMIDAEGLLEEDRYPYEPFEDSMMPEEFELAVDETKEYNVVFSIPDDITDVKVIYVEIDEDENEGATFTINHSL